MRSSPRSAGQLAPVLPERRDAQGDEPRVAALEHLSAARPPVEAPRPQVLDQRVGGGEQPREPRLASRARPSSARTEYLRA